jgi:hypothetical protein
VAFAFAIAASVIAAVASLLTGRSKQAASPEPLGAELAAVAAEGGLEPSEIVGPVATADEAAAPLDLRGNGHGNGRSPAVTKTAGTEPS